jgi:hypothetical protein
MVPIAKKYDLGVGGGAPCQQHFIINTKTDQEILVLRLTKHLRHSLGE